ncbi:MAG: hypothetical protein KGZ25_06290, partial [Planctomycetes bacterium]|nr:hypothetical protein [Planctomycetota bacterium]
MQLEKSHLFTPVESSEDDVTLYILDEKVAPLQQSFYFVNSGMSSDGRYLWFYCAFPPSPGKTLGVVDFESDDIRHFPETQFSGASPYVDPETAVCYWGARDILWRRGPGENDHTEAVNSLPEDLIGERTVYRFATHLTRSADDRQFFIDANIGLKYVFT